MRRSKRLLKVVYVIKRVAGTSESFKITWGIPSIGTYLVLLYVKLPAYRAANFV